MRCQWLKLRCFPSLNPIARLQRKLGTQNDEVFDYIPIKTKTKVITITISLLIVFPQIVNWLPSIRYRSFKNAFL
ncbi:protein of unknown function [Tepidanaerobacter acetatoxydans Re1]|uniref:Uncharacterized protein n=1 Tax=Tepidanaerobacter acetatoxydans (strain DSM 21804 / JCM 16047 / Re1) TaxID=1209989 RepID=U4Q982_TEPAE|nr:protein of unknown function [Tepidanaerobacter acetatoxydans Re1]